LLLLSSSVVFFEEQMLHVDSMMGAGSYGNVYRAVDEHGCAFALKRSDLYEKDGDLVLGTLREYILHNSLKATEGLCIAHRLWMTRHFAFFLLPLFEANLLELSKRLHRSLLFDDFCVIAHGVASSVKRLHEQGWMHRDIKPENIYTDSDGRIALGDFNLARFCDSSSEPARATRGSSSTHVCTLWTRAPELCVADLEGRSVLETSFEVDAFSVGATMLTVAAGGYVFGKRIASDAESPTESYLEGLFSVAGTDSLIRAAFPSLDHEKIQTSFADFATRLCSFLPSYWKEEDKRAVSTLLAKLLDPLPSRRGRVDCLLTLPTAHPTDQFSTVRFVARKAVSFDIAMPLPDLPSHLLKPPPSLAKPDSMWSQLGNWRVPIPLAIHAVLIRRGESSEAPVPSKSLLYLLRAVHRFAFSESLSLQRECVLRVLPSVRLDPHVWRIARQVETQPFLVCCLAAWVHVHGTPPPDVDTLSSDAMQDVLANPDVDVFFGSFGLQWKSQRSMLQSWRRL
jgi:serine/threonine protein kinase